MVFRHDAHKFRTRLCHNGTFQDFLRGAVNTCRFRLFSTHIRISLEFKGHGQGVTTILLFACWQHEQVAIVRVVEPHRPKLFVLVEKRGSHFFSQRTFLFLRVFTKVIIKSQMQGCQAAISNFLSLFPPDQVVVKGEPSCPHWSHQPLLATWSLNLFFVFPSLLDTSPRTLLLLLA